MKMRIATVDKDAPKTSVSAIAEDTDRIVMEVPPLDPVALANDQGGGPVALSLTDIQVGQAQERQI